MVSTSNLFAMEIIMRFFRHPKTQNERWQYGMTIVNEYGIAIKVRGAKSLKDIPTAWDDIMHAGNHKNWKTTRKVQYRSDG